MANAPIILAEASTGAVNDVFKPHGLAFRETRSPLATGRRCAVSIKGASATGSIQLVVDEAVLDKLSVPRERRQDFVHELTNLLVGNLEVELLRRGLAVRYTTPRAVTAAGLESFNCGTDGVVTYLEDSTAGRVAVAIELNLAPGAVLEASPARRPPERPSSKLNLPSVGKAPSGCVLVVDDSATARSGVLTALSGAGFEVVQADSGISALKLLRERNDIRVLFTDLHMAGLHGADLIRKIKADAKLSSLPIIVLTASPSAVSDVDPAHIVTCLIKPVAPAAVVSLATRLLTR